MIRGLGFSNKHLTHCHLGIILVMAIVIIVFVYTLMVLSVKITESNNRFPPISTDLLLVLGSYDLIPDCIINLSITNINLGKPGLIVLTTEKIYITVSREYC